MRKFIKNNWWKFVIILVAIIAILGIVLYYIPRKESAKIKCPDDYATLEDRIAAFKSFVSNLTDESKVLEERRQFFIDNKCDKAITRLGLLLSDKTDFEFTELFDRTYESELGFSFEYPFSYHVDQFNDDGDLFVAPFSEQELSTVYSGTIKKFSEESFITISIRENPKGATAMDWLKSEYSGYNFDNKYQEKLIGEINVLLLPWRDPNQIDGALFLSPDGKYRISVVSTGDTKALEEDLYKIVNTFLFEE